ncbi:nickel insertion protein [uncultured Parolsenella sp.]|uniref:LarC family nickel insertion protein n=1 Tax=uncultured Parolsenella sp. TaxID=2083008 RepID=UPI0025D337EA|nr:nickel insertion protein [uncultured Parolsenella sp.]
MGKTLFLDCSSGISGDMTVAALLDLGASEERLRAALATLPVAGEFKVAVSRVMKSGLAACDFDVRLDAAHENHDHDMAWLYGVDEAGEHVHSHDHAEHHDDEAHAHGPHEHCHGHDHSHGHHHHHAHRSLADVTAIIGASRLTERAKQLALAIFGKLAEAEAKAHAATPETVHFHEVGATDSIVDICSIAICLDDLGITDVIVPSLAEGHGTIRCAHGIMPVPVPAVVNLCQAADIELVPAPVHGELVTPTGAATVAALRTATELPARYRIVACGYGAGKRPYVGCSGLLRAQLVEVTAAGGGGSAPRAEAPDGPAASAETRATASEPGAASYALPFPTEAARTVTKLETDLDDCTGEALGHTIALLMAAGAREAHAVPVIMKKGRPGFQLEVVCDADKVAELERLIFENTTTIGVRSLAMRRDGLPRHAGVAETRFGVVTTKVVTMPDGSERAYPEYDSVVAAHERTGASFQDVFRATQAAADGAPTDGTDAASAADTRRANGTVAAAAADATGVDATDPASASADNSS